MFLSCHTTLTQSKGISVKWINVNFPLMCLTEFKSWKAKQHADCSKRLKPLKSISNLKCSVYDIPVPVWNCPFFSTNVVADGSVCTHIILCTISLELSLNVFTVNISWFSVSFFLYSHRSRFFFLTFLISTFIISCTFLTS